MSSGPILLLGASGFLGRNLLRDWSEVAPGPSLVGVSRHPVAPGAIPGPPGLHWLPFAGWERSLEDLRTHGADPVVIHLIALADHAACQRDPEAAMQANVATTVQAAQVCCRLAVPFITVGTDGVFSGTRPGLEPHYWPVGPPALPPADIYGRTKLRAEEELAALGWGHVIRLSFVGPSLGTGRGLVAYLARSLRQPDPSVSGWVDNFFTPLPTRILSTWLLQAAAIWGGGHSLRQWGCHPALTKYEFLEATAREAGFQPHMTAVRRAEALGFGLDQSLDCDQSCTRDDLIRHAARALRDELQ